MSFIVVGLGNPGSEYENTRHNTGRIVLDAFAKAHDFPEWTLDKKLNALVSKSSISSSSKGRAKPSMVLLIEPETFMNKSGESIKNLPLTTHHLPQGQKKIKIQEITNMVVIHDDLDIPFGTYKISFNKSSGGHRGVESIIKSVKTQAFTRVRVGIASSAAAVKKSQNETTVEKTILGRFTSGELAELKKLAKRIAEGLTVLITEGREKAMSQYQG